MSKLIDGKVQILLDAGHGGKDSGAVNGSRYEKNDTLAMALKVGQYLTFAGAVCHYTRTDDTYTSPTADGNMGNISGIDLLVAFHRDSSKNGSANGASTLVKVNSGTVKIIADRANQRMLEVGFHNRGTDQRSDLAVLNIPRIPAVLFETGFISNQNDNALFDKYFDRIAKAYAEATLVPFGISVDVNKQAAIAEPAVSKYPIAYNAHLVGMGYTDAKVDGEFVGDKDGKVAIDGIHIDTRRLPAGMQLKASVVSGGKVKDYGIINNNTLLGVANVVDKIEQLEFTSINPPSGYDFWYRLYFDGKPMQWTNRRIGTINTNMKLTGLQFRVCKLSELVN